MAVESLSTASPDLPALASIPTALHARVRGLLELALCACGAERAFLIVADEAGGHRVELCHTTRSDGRREPSDSTVHLALEANEALCNIDPPADLRLAGGGTARGLALRTFISAPVRARSVLQGVLLLDSRFPPRLPPHRAKRLIAGLADTLALLLSRDSDTPLPAAEARDDGDMVGHSPCFRALLKQIERVAATRLPVLIEGETGSGKDGIAQRLHRRSARGGGPFLAVNCAAFTESLLDVELFGATRGAYTGADRDRPGLFRLAQGGTLFLDEVGDMGPAMQSKLLRTLESGSVRAVGGDRELPIDVRVVAATHGDLADGRRFRTDLYYRLAVLRVRVPPLRERLDDLPLLVKALAPRLLEETGLGPPLLSPPAWSALYRHAWPGNVRELHAVIARAMLAAGRRRIEARHLEIEVRAAPRPDQAAERGARERAMIHAAMHEFDGNLTAAAKRIGWTRQKLYRRMKALGVPRG